MSDRILVVGATGFLGSVVTGRLLERRPIALARRTSDTTFVPAGVETRFGDLDAPADLPLDGVGTLVYCASMGFGHVPPLLARLRSSTVRRAVFISTTAIYTRLPTASHALRVTAEQSVAASPLDWTILRPTMIYGTARDRNISRLLRFLKRWPVFPLCGNALWQPVHVEDLADAVVAALDAPGTLRQAYNVAGADALSFADLVRTAGCAVGRKPWLVPLPVGAGVLAARLTRVVSPEQIRRLAEPKAFAITDAARDFGYRPRTFSVGVQQEARLLGLAPRGS